MAEVPDGDCKELIRGRGKRLNNFLESRFETVSGTTSREDFGEFSNPVPNSRDGKLVLRERGRASPSGE